MIASWMLYALLVSTLLGAAAWALEEVCRLVGAPVRWVWAGALAATLALVALAPLRTTPSAAPDLSGVMVRVTEPGATPAATGPLATLARTVGEARAALDRAMRSAAALGEGVPGWALGAGWAALSATLLAVAWATLRRGRWARRRWPLHEMAGVPVRVAPRVGPAVLGVRAPEVVVPEWLLEVSPEEQRLVVLHEREHIRARDPLLLAAGCVAAALVPWVPAAWWMLRRLRVAVELDCDARVLRRGVRPVAYGTLLIEMAGRGPGLTLGAPAMAGSPSSLERRLRAMNVRLPRFAPARAGLLGVLGLAVLAAACETSLPTTAEVDRMDVASVESHAEKFQIFEGGGNLKYTVDGKAVTAAEARALTAGRIAQIQVHRTPEGGTVDITTGEAAPGQRLRTPGATGEIMILRRDSSQARVHVSELNPGGTGPVRIRTGERFEGLTVVDGRVVTPTEMRTLAAGRIDKVEVIKGPRAAELYPNDPRAAHGVIRITTKAAAQ